VPQPEPPMKYPQPWNLIDWLRHPTDNGLGRTFVDAGRQFLNEDVLPVANFMLRNVLPGSIDLQSVMDAKDYSARTMNDLYAGRPLDALADLGYTALGVAGVLPAVPNLIGATRRAGEALEQGLSKLSRTQAAQRLETALSHLDEDAWRVRDRSEIGRGGNATADILARYAVPAANSLQSLMDARDYSQQMWDDLSGGRFLPALENAGFMAGSVASALHLFPNITEPARRARQGRG
jgi:hypothetical protein